MAIALVRARRLLAASVVDASIANLGIINLSLDVQLGPVSGTIPADGAPG